LIPKFGLSEIPNPTKSFLRRLGFNLQQVREFGFEEIKEQLLKISNSEKTGLNKREKQVVKLRLDGKDGSEIGKALSSSRQWASKFHTSAIKKIKIQLEKKRPSSGT